MRSDHIKHHLKSCIKIEALLIKKEKNWSWRKKIQSKSWNKYVNDISCKSENNDNDEELLEKMDFNINKIVEDTNLGHYPE